MEMKWLLHEKIQLYIYKPSINKVISEQTPATGTAGTTNVKAPYYGGFNESLTEYYPYLHPPIQVLSYASSRPSSIIQTSLCA